MNIDITSETALKKFPATWEDLMGTKRVDTAVEPYPNVDEIQPPKSSSAVAKYEENLLKALSYIKMQLPPQYSHSLTNSAIEPIRDETLGAELKKFQTTLLYSKMMLEYVSLSTEDAFRQLFSAARNEVFEDGMESIFSRRLTDLIQKHKEQAIRFAEDYLDSEEVDEEVAAETLRQLGHNRHKYTYSSRLSLLVHGLKHDSSMVRDGAILGLASMGDRSVIRQVRDAMLNEEIPELRDDMNDVLEQLRETPAKR